MARPALTSRPRRTGTPRRAPASVQAPQQDGEQAHAKTLQFFEDKHPGRGPAHDLKR